jgi:hypothetical protein
VVVFVREKNCLGSDNFFGCTIVRKATENYLNPDNF